MKKNAVGSTERWMRKAGMQKKESIADYNGIKSER